MGIQGLLPALKSITTPTNVKEYAGMRAAVDTYSWLHKAAFSCSKDICQGQTTSKFINYCMHRVNLLRHHGVRPVLVFDGGRLPMKAEQEEKRSRARKEQLERAHGLEASGNHAAAYEYYQKAVDITPAIAFQLIQVLRQHKVDFIVAPYEADAQMAFLSLHGLVDVIITEDSDLIAYGCSRILFKMDKFGQGVEFQYADLVKNKDLNFTNFTKKMVLEMCIFSGCDYLPSLQGMGVKRAHNLLRRFRSYQKIIKHLRFSGVSIPKIYEEKFEKALLTFSHQRVYDPVLQDMVHLTEIPPDLDVDLQFLGPKTRLSQILARQIAEGSVDPVTHMPFKHLSPSTMPQEEPSLAIFSDTLKQHVKRKEQRHLDLPAQKNVLTNYFISKSEASKQQFKAPRYACGSIAVTEDAVSQEETPVTCSSPRTPTTMSTEEKEYPDYSCVPVTPEMELDLEFQHASKRVRIQQCEWSSQPLAQRSPDLATCSSPEHSLVKSYSMRQHKVIVRSRYFPCTAAQNDTDENDESISNEDLSPGEGRKHASQDATTPNQGKKHASKGTKLSSRTSVKRKTTPIAACEPSFPKFSSKLLGDDMDKNVTLSTNVGHVKEYSFIAEASMEKFTAAISSFKCPTHGGGARVSGLRAPLKHNLTNIDRWPTKEVSTDGLFNQFALTDSRVPRTNPARRSVLVPVGSREEL